MRGLRKPWPPRDVSPEGQQPRRLVEAERDFLTALGARPSKTESARSAFDQLNKAKLRDAMYREQKALCVYCERRLDPGTRHPVEHWRPLSRRPKYALHWRNLYLSCSTTNTCDAAKDNQRLVGNEADPDLPWPTQLDYERLVGFDGLGEMYVREDVPIPGATRDALKVAIDGDGRRNAILNLNDPRLRAARAAALDSERDSLERDFKNRTAPRKDREARAVTALNQKERPAFVSIRVHWLRKTLGRGR